jgi:hypothetical protein
LFESENIIFWTEKKDFLNLKQFLFGLDKITSSITIGTKKNFRGQKNFGSEKFTEAKKNLARNLFFFILNHKLIFIEKNFIIIFIHFLWHPFVFRKKCHPFGFMKI